MALEILINNNNLIMIALKNQDFQNKNMNQKATKSQSSKNYGQINQDQTLKQVYMCSCGKQYLSFPATYLHFRSKHNIKLSTKPTQRRRVVTIEGQTKKITYLADLSGQQNNSKNFINQNQESKKQDPTMSQQIKIIESCIEKYLQSSRHSSKTLFEKLIEYFKLLSAEEGHSDSPVNTERIPYFLNDFMMVFLPNSFQQITIGNQKWKQSCVQLSRFCNWLRKQKFTDLVLLYERE